MMSRPRLPLTPMILALAAIGAAAHAEDGAPAPSVVGSAPAAESSPTSVVSDAAVAEAEALYRKAEFVECRDKVDEALRLSPAHPRALALRQDVLAVLSQRDNRLQMAATWFRTMRDVRTQETAIRIDGLIRSGDTKAAKGDFAGAELDYDRAGVSLRSFPYAFDWGDLPKTLDAKRRAAGLHVREQADQRQETAREEAEQRAKDAARLQEKAVADKVDELLRRARESYDRKDFRRAEVDAWNAYELDRRREDARDLYLSARREGHDAFDDKHESERSERLARLNEEVHRSLIPQTELLVYPEDWARRTLRKPREIGSGKEEAWRAALLDRLEQKIDFDFSETPLEEAINYFRQVTGATIVVAPEVLAGGGGGNVTLKGHGMTFGKALRWLMQISNLNYALQNQAIYISKTQVTGSVVLRLYDVADLVQHPRDMPGRELAFSSAGAGGAGAANIFAPTTEQPKAADPQELVDFIKKNVASTTWTNDGVGIDLRSGSVLFISQVPEVHAQIEQLLATQRNLTSLQVSIDIRVLRVRKNYFEDIGFDWRHDTGQSGKMLNSSSTSGYSRQNDTSQWNASVNNATMPGTSVTDYNPATRGLFLDISHSPFSFLNRDQVNVLMHAVENEGDSQFVEHPQLTCYNGQRANASFMHQLAYISDYEIVSRNYDPKIQVLNYGNIIDIRPVVSSDRKYVTMEVRPSSVSKDGIFTDNIVGYKVIGRAIIGGQKYPIEMPNMGVHSLRSTVMIPDKASLLIGGFQKSGRETTSTGIPFLSNIPFLGRLFSQNATYDLDDRTFYLLHTEILDLAEKEAAQ